MYMQFGNKGNNKITELRTILQRESQNSYVCLFSYCAVFRCLFSYCTVLHCLFSYCTVFHCLFSYCTVFHCIFSYCTVPVSVPVLQILEDTGKILVLPVLCTSIVVPVSRPAASYYPSYLP
jgi:hypothetical protein